MARRRLVLVDGTAIIYRAYFAIPGHLATAFGLHTNAIYGFATMFQKLFAGRHPDFGAVVFDAPGRTFRDEQYEDYKADRAPMQDEMREQLPWIDRLVTAHRFPILRRPGYEADDVIGTLSRRALEDDMEVLIVSGDKDFCQLIEPRVRMLDSVRDITYDETLVRKKWGVPPTQFVDLLALMGDKIDNIPGVVGIGKKGAAQLLERFKSLDGILQHIDELTPRQKKALTEHKDDAVLSRSLAAIDQRVPLDDVSFESLVIETPPPDELNALYRELEFYSLLTGTDLPEATERSAEIVEDVSALVAELGKAETVAVAPVHDRPSAIFGKWVGVAFAWNDRVVYVPLDAKRIALLAAWFKSDVVKIVHDVKSLWLLLDRHDLALAGTVYDTMLGSYLVDPTKNIPHRLEQLTKAYLHRTR